MTVVTPAAAVQRPVEFNILSKAMFADEDLILKELGLSEPDGKRRLMTIASSSVKDLSGDEMTSKALETMRSTAEENMTIFLNHKYQVPKDIFGSVEKAWLDPSGDDVDLKMIIRVNERNADAIETHEAIKDGTKLGCSIGALIPQGGATKTETGLKIDEVQLLEASIVGIPANPKSFVQYATKAYRKAELDDVPEDEIESSGPPKPILNAADEAQATGLPAVAKETPAPEEPAAPAESPAPPAAPEDIQQDAAAAPADNGDADAGTEPEPTTEAAQDAPVDESTPENDGAVDKTAVDTQVELAKSAGLNTLADMLKDVTTQLVAKSEELRVEKAARIEAETRASDAEADLAVAKEIVSIIETLPMGKHTAYKQAATDFRKRVGGVYSPEVMDLIDRNPKG